MTEQYYTFMGALDALITGLKPPPPLAPAPVREDEDAAPLPTSQKALDNLVDLHKKLKTKAEEVSEALSKLRRAESDLAGASSLGAAGLALAAAHLNTGVVAAVSMADFQQEPAGKKPFLKAVDTAATAMKELLGILEIRAQELYDAISALADNFPRIDPELSIIMERTKNDIAASGLLQGGGGEGGGYWPSNWGGSGSSSGSSSGS